MKKRFLFLILTLSACSTCNVVKQTSIKEIQFGHGGGVAQSITKYSIKPDGYIYNGEVVIGKVKRSDLMSVYKDAASLDFNTYDLPSNTFSFIRIVKTDTTLYYCWNGVAPLPIMGLDTKLHNLLPK